MKNKLLLIILICIFSTLLINPQTEEEIIEATSNEKYWKRHFFDLCLVGGLSFGTGSYYITSEQNSRIDSGDEALVTVIYIGGLIGASFGYQYAFTNNFAFGPGFSAFLNIMGNGYYEDLYYDNNHYISYLTKQTGSIGVFSGGTFMFMFMFGDLKNKKIAFLFDVGGGILVSAKLGLYIKGFVFKTGYAFTGVGPNFNDMTFGHHITLDFGYKFNWKNKFEGKTFKKNK